MGSSGMGSSVGLAVVTPVEPATIAFHDISSFRVFPGRWVALVPTRIFSSIALILIEVSFPLLGAKIRAGGGALVGAAVSPVVW